MRGRLLTAAVTLVVLAGCTSGGPLPAALAWTRVTLPEDARPASLALAGSDVLVGGVSGGGTNGSGQTAQDASPRLFRLGADGSTHPLALHPDEPTAAIADLVSLTVAGEEAYAIGKAVSGAHSNPRLSVWDGTVTSGLTSRPQEFFTFGGHDAGPLLGTAVVAGDPVIFGSRTANAGTKGLLWTRSGHTWVQQAEADPALTSGADRELGFSALATLGDRLVVAGDEVGLLGGLRQQPAVFVGTVSGPWSETLLPVPDDLVPVSGQLTRATSLACGTSGSTCWVAGWARGHPLAWELRISAAGTTTVGTPTVFAGDPPGDTDPIAVVTIAAGHPLVFTNAAVRTAQLGCPGRWQEFAAPPAPVSAATGEDGLYAITADGLWRAPPPSC